MNSPPDTAPFDIEALSQMLAACQFTLKQDGHGPTAIPQAPAPASPEGFVSALADLGVIRVQGDDRLTFLQGQLTNDIDKLEIGAAQWTGLCSPKGRLLATFLALKEEASVRLVVSRELAGAVSKRLSMYVLRSKVKVTDLSAQTLVFGVVGPGATKALQAASLALPDPMKFSDTGSSVVTLPSVSVQEQIWPRALVITSADQVEEVCTSLQKILPAQATAWWRTTEVVAGTARITPPVQEAFVPQMINFELIDGVDFEKGCYTGQEVVARSQYLGKMKRRMFLGSFSLADDDQTVDTPPGTPVNGENDSTIGTVVSSAPGAALGLPDTRLVLFESRVDGVETATIDGHAVNALSLPYEIPEPAPFVRPR